MQVLRVLLKYHIVLSVRENYKTKKKYMTDYEIIKKELHLSKVIKFTAILSMSIILWIIFGVVVYNIANL